MNAPAAALDARTIAAEMAAAFHESRAPRIRVDNPGEWAGGVDRLLLMGQLEAAEHNLRHLHTAGVRTRYSTNLLAVFDQLPPVDGTLPFADDAGRDVQIVTREGADAVLLLFCGGARRLGLPLPLIHRWFGRLPASLVYLRDFRRALYMRGVQSLGADLASSVAALRDIVTQLRASRIYCFGTSIGAFASVRYGLDIGAQAVLAAAGYTNLTPSFNMYLRSRATAERLHAIVPEENLDIRELYMAASTPPRVRFVFGEDNWDDRIQAENMAGVPSVEFLRLPACGDHGVVRELICRGLFPQTLHWLFERQGGS